MIYIQGYTDASFREFTEEGSMRTKSRGAFYLDNKYACEVFKYPLDGIDTSIEAEISAIKLAIQDILKLHNAFREELLIHIFCDCIPAMEIFKRRYPHLMEFTILEHIPSKKNPAHKYCRIR